VVWDGAESRARSGEDRVAENVRVLRRGKKFRTVLSHLRQVVLKENWVAKANHAQAVE